MKNIERFITYMLRTFKNKLFVAFMFIVGLALSKLCDDGTFMVFVLMFGIPLFITKKDWFYRPQD